MSNLKILLASISAVVLFLYGLEAFSAELQKSRGSDTEQVAGKADRKPLARCLVGRSGHGDRPI